MPRKTACAAIVATLLFATAQNLDAQQPTSSAPVAAEQPSAPPLIIGAGDLIEVGMFDSPELSGRFRVDQNGDVDLPLLGIVHVSGMTAQQAAKLIEDRYVEAQILKPEASRASIYIAEYATQGITVSGEVKTPGIYPAFGIRMLNDVITAAGGLTPTSASKVILTRREDRAHPMTVDYNPAILPPVIPNVQVGPGDTVLVPKAGIVYVLGNVIKAGGFVLDGRNTLTIEAAMALAGGEGRYAALKRAQVVRTLPDGSRETVMVRLDQIIKGNAADVALQDGDILYIPTSTGKQAAAQTINSAIGIGTQVAVYKTALK